MPESEENPELEAPEEAPEEAEEADCDEPENPPVEEWLPPLLSLLKLDAAMACR